MGKGLKTMLRTLSCVTLALLLAGASGWAQGGAYTTKFRVTPPAPTAPNPFSRGRENTSSAPFGASAPQHFSAPPLPDTNRNLNIFIRNRIISQRRPGHVATPPTSIDVPDLLYPSVDPHYPYSDGLRGTDPASQASPTVPQSKTRFSKLKVRPAQAKSR